MILLTASLRAWGTPAFEDTLKAEVGRLDAAALPLQQGLASTSYALDDPVSVRILQAAELGDRIRVKLGIFYTGVIAGCSCADDPTPVNEQTEYCEARLEIRKDTAEATITLLE